MAGIINPWASHQYKDYAKLRDEFGIEEFSFDLPDAPPIFRRGVIFGHRGFNRVYRAILNRERFAVLTGLMPSGRMHLGHKMVIDQVLYYQKMGGDITIAVADIEAYGARNVPLDAAKDLALREYVRNYIALGLDPGRARVYFQSRRKAVTDLAYILGKRTNLSEVLGIYGFEPSVNMAHLFAPLVQIGDILHVQLDEYGGMRPTVVPVGVDQDPHIRLTREVARRARTYSVKKTEEGVGVFVKSGDAEALLVRARRHLEGRFSEFDINIPYGALYVKDASSPEEVEEIILRADREENPYAFYLPASTYHRFMTGLTGGKMSSSDENSAIFLSDSPEMARKKVMRALTGGGQTVQEHREKGGNPDVCAVYELYVYHLEKDDERLREIYDSCRRGERLCGGCKKEAANLLESLLRNIQEKAAAVDDAVMREFVEM